VARKIKEFPDAPVQSMYPWDDWFDGSVWELTPGEDFKGRPTTFRSSAIAQAARRNGTVRTRKITRSDGVERLYLQFHPGEPSAYQEPEADQYEESHGLADAVEHNGP
jgi:hypothetical protein